MDFETILNALLHNSNVFKNKTAVIDAKDNKSITYGELWKRIINFSALLKSNGFKSGERAIIRVTQRIECLVAIYGVQLMGGIAIPVEADLSENRIKDLLDYFDSNTLISTQPASFKCNFFNLQDVLSAPDDFEQLNLPKADDLALILYTTGTTGASKGVMLTFRNRIAGADNQSVEINMSSGDVGLISQPLSHSGGLRRCDALFLYGGTAVLINGVGMINDFLKALTEYKVTILWFVPAQFSLISKFGGKQLADLNGKLRVVIFESAKPFESQKEELRKLLPNVRLYVNYSSTEATGTCHFEYSAFPVMHDCVGKGITPHSKVLFVDENGCEVEATKDMPAIIASEGDSVALGYWKEPELTAKTFINGRVISADVGYKDADGYIYVTGRRDDIIISGGNKISPSEVEEAAMLMNGIRECACIPVPDAVMGYVPKLYVVMVDGVNFSVKDILNHLSQELEPFKIPKKIECIDELPRIGVGKISRRLLIEMEQQRSEKRNR